MPVPALVPCPRFEGVGRGPCSAPVRGYAEVIDAPFGGRLKDEAQPPLQVSESPAFKYRLPSQAFLGGLHEQDGGRQRRKQLPIKEESRQID